MMNMRAVLFTDESRASPNDSDSVTKGMVFNGDNCARRQSGSVVMIWGGMIGNELTGVFRAPEELKLSADMYCSFLKKSIEP